MQATVYIDMLFLINAVIGYFILRAASILCKTQVIILRLIASSVFSGFSSFIILLPQLPVWASWLFKIATSIIIVIFAFSFKSKRILAKLIFWYLLLNILLAGTVIMCTYYLNSNGMQTNNLSVYFDISPPVLLLCVVSVYLCVKLSDLFFGVSKSSKNVNIQFKINDKLVSCTALLDSGFNVKDVLAGKKVFLLSYPSLKDKLPYNVSSELIAYFNGDTPSTKFFFHLICVKTASGTTALPSIKVLDVTVMEGIKKRFLKEAAAAFCNERLGDGSFEAIIGTDFN